jgi:hypothetical protein
MKSVPFGDFRLSTECLRVQLVGAEARFGTPQNLLGIRVPGPEGTLTGIFEAHIIRHFIEHFERGHFALHGEGGEQQVVADGINQARNALRTEVNFIEQVRRQDRLCAETGAGHTRIDIGESLFGTKAA